MAAPVLNARNTLFAFKKLRFSSIVSFSRSFSSKDGNKEDEPSNKISKETLQNERKIAASKKLASLLASFEVEGASSPKQDTFDLNLAKPTIKMKPIPSAKEQIEKEISKEPIALERDLDMSLRSAAELLASSLSGDPVVTESELLQRLRMHVKEANDVKIGKTVDVGKLFVGMKIDRVKPTPQIRRQQNRNSYQFDENQQSDEGLRVGEVDRRRYDRERALNNRELQKGDTKRKLTGLFDSKRLGIFKELTSGEDETPVDMHLNIWNKLEEHELKLLVTYHPTNGFEEMIRWTEEGKLWHFPINNEYGLDEESKVEFYEHVFLEDKLEGFPTKGPIRHFMELVVVGLSKNPYITVQRKHHHIEWFRKYFEDKKDILQEVGALG